ncbi:MAG: hypothetical protein KJ061_00845 [Vicinamibacteraceae bacterium]|nr:hypothetical protein [Vicinamibacteraceae bacterium]
MDVPYPVRVALITVLVSGVLAPLTLWLPERWQGLGALTVVVLVALVLVITVGRWLRGRGDAQQGG